MMRSVLALALVLGVCLVGTTSAITVDKCRDMIVSGHLPVTEDFANIQEAIARLPYHNVVHAHPEVDKSIEHTALYMCAVDDIYARDALATTDIALVEKQVLNITMNMTTEIQLSRTRSANDDSFFDGLLGALADSQGVSVHSIINEVTNGWWNCVRNAVATGRELYRLFVAGTGTLLDTVHRLASAIVDCISAATNSSPVGWLRRIWQGARLVLRATSIARDCGGLWSTYRSHGFNSYEMGRGVGVCINTIAGRRRRALEGQEVPEAWTCDPAFYNAMDGCDVGCGAFDPDCSDPAEPVHYNFDRHIDFVPANITWNCPSIFYNASDGCDMGCGSWDPDCDSSSNNNNNSPIQGVSSITWRPAAAMSVMAEKQYDATLALAHSKDASDDSSSSSSGTHSLTSAQLGLLIAGTAVVTMVVCVAVFAAVSRKNRRSGSGNLAHKLVTNEDEDESTTYSLH